MKTSNKKIRNIFILAVVFAVGALALRGVEFADLSYISGSIVSVELKANGVGALLEVGVADGEGTVWLNVPNLSKQRNAMVRNFVGGEKIEAWYSTRFRLKHKSYEVWQLIYGRETLVRYEDEILRSKTYVYLFSLISLVLFLFSGIYWVRQKKEA